jgi:hypothetical protein
LENKGLTSQAARVYRLSVWIRLTAISFFVFCVLGLFGLLWSQTPGFERRNPVELLEWTTFAVFAACWMFYAFSASIVLLDHAIVKRTPVKTDRLRFSQIRGRRKKVYRNFDGSYVRYLQIVPRDELSPVIKFQQFYAFDREFNAWFDGLPDLDAEWKENERDRNFGLV